MPEIQMEGEDNGPTNKLMEVLDTFVWVIHQGNVMGLKMVLDIGQEELWDQRHPPNLYKGR